MSFNRITLKSRRIRTVLSITAHNSYYELLSLSQDDLRKCVCWENFRPIFHQCIDIAQLFFREICTRARSTNQTHILYLPRLSLKKQGFIHELLAAHRIALHRIRTSLRSSYAEQQHLFPQIQFVLKQKIELLIGFTIAAQYTVRSCVPLG